jgi:hypothetical protein
MIKLGLLAYVIAATGLLELAATGLLLASVQPFKNGNISVERITAERHRSVARYLTA